jgi:hypothetical protein
VQGDILKTLNLKKLVTGTALGLFAIVGASSIASGQNRDDRREAKQQQKIARQQAKIEQQRARLVQQRQSEWARRNGQLVITRRSNGATYYTLDPSMNVQPPGRYRVYRNGRWYNTDNSGADLLREAVNEGYRQGFTAGRSDYSSSRRGSWSNSNIYRSGTSGYRNGVDRGQYQYYFRQGFQRGYQDGTNSRFQDGYTGAYEYGTYNNGTPSILGTILNQILNIQSY